MSTSTPILHLWTVLPCQVPPLHCSLPPADSYTPPSRREALHSQRRRSSRGPARLTDHHTGPNEASKSPCHHSSPTPCREPAPPLLHPPLVNHALTSFPRPQSSLSFLPLLFSSPSPFSLKLPPRSLTTFTPNHPLFFLCFSPTDDT